MSIHAVIPDVQFKPGNDARFLERIGMYLVEKKPDTIVQIGDFADMPSLSSYDVGKKSFEGRRYAGDIAEAKRGMAALLAPIHEFNKQAKKNGKKQYSAQKKIKTAIITDPEYQ